MDKKSKPILVTGSHRSGTTWAGKCLSLAPNTGYIHEPFNIGFRIPVIDNPMPYWFQYICNENEYEYKNALNKVIHYHYPLLSNLNKVRSVRNAAKIIREQGIFLSHKIKGNTPIVKDPIAFFSAEWLSKNYDMNVLIMIRHPAAFCSSLKLKNWKFDFNNFLNQPLLMNRYLYPFKAEIREFTKTEKTIIEQAILLWNCIHQTVKIYQQEHAEWLFVRHEDLSLDPLGKFEYIYNKLSLEFSPAAKAGIINSSGSHNPAEQQAGNEFIRNSKENIYNWKKRLTSEEIEIIKVKTKEISSSFYEEDEW